MTIRQNERGVLLKKFFILFSLIIISLAGFLIINEASNKTPYMLLGISILNLFNGIYSYRVDKKTSAAVMFLISFIGIGVSVSIIL